MMFFTLQLETKIVDAVDAVQCSAVQWSSSLWLPRKSCIVGRSPPSVMTSTSPRITSNDQKFSPVSMRRDDKTVVFTKQPGMECNEILPSVGISNIEDPHHTFRCLHSGAF